jgi:hypothetical protein
MKNLTDSIRAASQADTQSSKAPTTEKAKSKTAVPGQRMTKAESSLKNSLKSTGPNTPRGKRHSRCNALTHGLYNKDLLISEKDRPAFEELRQQLQLQYKPSTPTRWLAFDTIVACSWRCKLAVRLESRQCDRQLETNAPSQPESGDTGADPYLLRWYGSSRQDIRAGIKALNYASAEFASLGYLQDATKEFLSRGFGPEFVDDVCGWTSMSKDQILLARMLVRHAEKFRRPLPLCPKDDDPPKVELDPQQAFEMVAKLFSERQRFLEELLKIRDQKWSDGEGREAGPQHDFNPGFLAAANRELRRAVDWYMHLVEIGL